MVNRSQQRTMKRRSGGDVSDRRGARALNGSHSITATNIAVLDLRLRSHRKKDSRSERRDHEPTRVGIHKMHLGIDFLSIEPSAQNRVSSPKKNHSEPRMTRITRTFFCLPRCLI